MRAWNPWVAWVAVVDVVGTLFLIGFLATGHHEPLVRAWAVLMWVLVVPGIPAVVKRQQRRQS